MESLHLVCFDGIYRVYRNTVVRHIRHQFKTHYPDTWLVKLTAPIRKEWPTVSANAQLRRQTGELDNPLVDEFDYLSINHFFNLFERYFSVIFPGVPETPEIAYKATRSSILSRCKHVKSLRDPVLGHPSEVPISSDTAYDMLNSARYILQHIDPEAADELERLRDSIFSVDVHSLPDDSTLPSRESIVSTFVGRREELDQLQRWLRDPTMSDHYLWLLAGDGGKGKTAIAYEFATQVRDDPPPHLGLENVIWASAKARRFLSGRTVDFESPEFSGLEPAIDWILRACAAPDYVLDLPLLDKKRECLDYLTECPSLVVLDDVDTLTERDETVSFFVQNIRSTKSRLLLTSRRIPALFGSSFTQVKGLSEEDGLEFVRTRIEMYRLTSGQFTKKIRQRIVSTCDSSPLFMEDLLRLCRVGEAPGQAIRLWKDYKGEAARKYALGREYEMLTEPAQNVLLACALFGGYVSLEDISLATDLAEDYCHQAIEELQGLFLVPEPHVVRDLPRFILNTNTRRLVIEVYGHGDAARRIEGMVRAVSGKSQATRESRELLGRFIRRADRYAKQQNYEAARDTLTNGIKRFPYYADLYGKLGWLYKAWRPTRYTDARNAFIQAANLNSTNEDMYWHWWTLETRQKEWTAAAEAAEKGLKIIPDSISLSYAAGYARSLKAKDLQYTHLGQAEREARKAVKYLRAARDILMAESWLPSEATNRTRWLVGVTYRAIVLNYERLARIMNSQSDYHSERHFRSRLTESLDDWRLRDPEDPQLLTETQRLNYQSP